MASAVFRAEVRHARLRPLRHALASEIFMLLLDLDSLEDTARRSRLFSLDGFNLLSLRTRDHGDGSGQPLRQQIAARIAAQGLDWDGGPVRMLVMPRVLGYAFNPLTVYFCHDRDETLRAVGYEVHNTFGERHFYILPVEPGEGPVRQQAEKRFYVSPFLGPDMRYRFRLAAPGERLALRIVGEDRDGPVIVATLRGSAQAWSDRALLRVFLSAPFLGWKVIAAIHWEALKLWWKGAPYHRRAGPARGRGLA